MTNHNHLIDFEDNDQSCESCSETEDLTYSEDGELLCIDCLFEQTCRDLFDGTE